MSSVDFIAASRRFLERRRDCETLYLDNATSFVGAKNALILNKKENEKLAEEIGFRWKFITPRSPHFGGTWETAVRSFKSHLVKTYDSCVLTLPELETVSVRIEAVPNDRPLCYRRVGSLVLRK